jgi:hypothetical protein
VIAVMMRVGVHDDAVAEFDGKGADVLAGVSV